MAQKATRGAARDVFSFQDLPPELRNSIYEYYLAEGHVDESQTSVASAASTDQNQQAEVASTTRAREHPPPQPALACTNHQIRGELLPLYYASTCFSFDVSSQRGQRRARAWMSANKHHFKHLRTLCACGKIDEYPATFTVSLNDDMSRFDVDVHLPDRKSDDFDEMIGHYRREYWLLRKEHDIIRMCMGICLARSHRAPRKTGPVFAPHEWVDIFEGMCLAFHGRAE